MTSDDRRTAGPEGGPGATRGAPPEHHDTPTRADAPHRSAAPDSTPPHGDPLRREIDSEADEAAGPPDHGTRHGADAR